MQTIPCVIDYSKVCDACQEIILDHNWHIHVVVDGKDFHIHDNDGICLSKLKVMLRIQEPDFLSSRTVTM